MTDSANSHCRKGLCLKCSRRHRSIASTCTDKKMVQWFNGLAGADLAEYRKIMSGHEASIGDKPGAKTKGKFDLLESLV